MKNPIVSITLLLLVAVVGYFAFMLWKQKPVPVAPTISPVAEKKDKLAQQIEAGTNALDKIVGFLD